MKQILKKLVQQKTEINKDIGKINYKIERNEEEINKIEKEVKTIERTIRNRKNKIKKFDDFSLRRSELKSSIIQYEIDMYVLTDRLLELEGLKNKKLKVVKRLRYIIKNMKQNSVRCGNCEIEIHRASYSRHLKSKRHLENISQKKVIYPKRQVVKDNNKVLDIDIKHQILSHW